MGDWRKTLDPIAKAAGFPRGAVSARRAEEVCDLTQSADNRRDGTLAPLSRFGGTALDTFSVYRPFFSRINGVIGKIIGKLIQRNGRRT
jgi:hypothetical protein